MIKGAIFDLDGTLLNSMYIWETMGEDYLRELGYTPREGLNATFKTMSLYKACCYYITEYGVTKTVQELMDGINKKAEYHYFNTVTLKEGISEFLEELRRRGIKMCIATATDRYQVEAVLKRLGIEDYFSAIFTCSEVGHGKKNPEIYRQALAHLGTEKSLTPVFEDSLFAIETLKNDGFVSVGIYDSFNSDSQTDVKALADFYLPDYISMDGFWEFAERL